MTDTYKIGVSIALANGVSPVLAMIGRDLLGVNAKISDVEKGLSRWKLAIGGAVAMLGGAALLGAMGKLADKGSELSHLQQRMAAAGMTQVEQAKAIAKAWELTARYKSVGVRTVGETILETMPAYGSAASAINLADVAVQAQVVLQGVLGDKGKDAVDQMFAGAKAAELRNIALNPAATRQFFDDMVKVAAVSNGRVSPQDFFQFIKYSRANAPYLDERFLAGVAPTLIQELGPSGAGNAITTLGQTVIGGRMTKRSAMAMEELGLIKPSDVIRGMGMGVYLRHGGVRGWQTAEHDPYEWAQETLLPALVAHGFKTPIDQRLEFGKLFGQRMAETMANILVTQAPRVEKDRRLYARAPGLASADALLAHDLPANEKAFHEQLNNMLIAIGRPLVGPAVEGLKAIAGVFMTVAQFATAHPEAVKVIGEAVVALGAALVVGGAIAIGAAAIGGIVTLGTPALIAVGVAAVTGAIGTLAAFNWSSIEKGIGGFIGWLKARDKDLVAPPTAPPGADAPPGMTRKQWASEQRDIANQNAQLKWVLDSAAADFKAAGDVAGAVLKNMATEATKQFRWIADRWHDLMGVFGLNPAPPKPAPKPANDGRPGDGIAPVWTPPKNVPTTDQFKAGLVLQAKLSGLLPWSAADIAKNPKVLGLPVFTAKSVAEATAALNGPGGVSKSAAAAATALGPKASGFAGAARAAAAAVGPNGLARSAHVSSLALTGPGGFAAELVSAAASIKAAVASLGAAAKPSAVPTGHTGQHTTIHIPVHLDGRKVADVISPHLGKSLSGSRVSRVGYDPNVHEPSSALGYAH